MDDGVRCGAHHTKRPWLLCRRRPMKGHSRCKLHSAWRAGGSVVRHATDEGRAAWLVKLKAGHARYLEEWRKSGTPYPCRPKSLWTPAFVAYLFRRWPHAVKWKREAASRGLLTVPMAVNDPERVEREALWALPNSMAANYLPPE